MPRQDLGQFLFDLPGQSLPRKERVRLLRQVVQGEEELTQEHLDHVLTKLLEEVQRED